MSDEGSRLLGQVQTQTDPSMLIVTTADGDERAGCLAGFGTQCSIHPPRYLACVSKENHTWAVAQRAETLVVHFPPADAHDLAQLFGGETGDEVDKFAGVGWTSGPGGSPVLDRCPDWIGGPIVDRVDLGDHTGMVIDVTEGGTGPMGERHLHFLAVQDVDPGHPA
jgi:flavin reductase (DIM6/NTAB) family NADH-FMN oxidoreductase RutF